MRLISIAAFAGLLAVPAYATNPSAGLYAASIYVENVEGGGCIDPLGRLSTGTLNYYGLAGRKAGFRVPIAGFSAASSSTQVLTITSGAGTTNEAARHVYLGGERHGDKLERQRPFLRYNYSSGWVQLCGAN